MNDKRLKRKTKEVKDKTRTHTFEFPANVKQIGGINSGVKIYIEDYAYTYIQRLGRKKDRPETAALLVGFITEELGETILVIMGAIEPPALQPSKDGQTFTEKDISYGLSVIDKYFEGMEIVGWARVQPGYGLYLSATDIGNHYLNFTDKNAVLLLCDTDEKLDCFFSWNENQDDLDECTGYFIFYDKNPGMNAFLSELKKPYEKSGDNREIYDAVEAATAQDKEDEKKLEARAVKNTSDGSRAPSEKSRRRTDANKQKRVLSMMTSVSMLLMLACVILVIGMLQSGERISQIESQMRELRTGYNAIVSKINDGAYPAFAAQTQSDSGTSRVTDEINKALLEREQAEQSLEAAIGISAPNAEPAEYNAANDVPANVEQTAAETAAPPQVETSVPEQTPPTPAEAPAETAEDTAVETAVVTEYIIKSGDTLSQISQLFYGNTHNVEQIMRANGITNPHRLTVGMKIIVP